ncbi:DNA repair exonuclease [Heliothis virescens ascovirus 3j]|uniref:DNA repair exonuclease n=2 Tax=unclassified Ascovirus TaxID=328613 RepID=A0A2Z5UZG0_9VIRU|nr:DNA repair exonuclease [Heliothis virescens ascovirus 3h]BBB16541.1 DNA repair exonuclease [Heliothis virescens ascovirus 3j]
MDDSCSTRGRRTIDRLLFVGDPHFKRDNFEQTQCYAAECVLTYSNMTDDDGRCCVLAGDILDGHGVIDMQCLNRAVRFINDLAVHGPVFVLIGNHDYYNNSQYLSENHWMNCLKNHNGRVFVIDKPTMVDGVVFAPYVPNGRFLEALNVHTPQWKHARLIVAHQELRGVSLRPDIVSVSGDVWNDDYPQLVSGHIHTRQKINNNIWYPGSVIQQNFGDHGESVVVVLNIDRTPGNGYTYKDVKISVPTKRYYEVQCHDLIKDHTERLSELKSILQAGGPLLRVKVRITISDLNLRRHPYVLKFLKSLPTGVGFAFKYVNVGPTGADKFDQLCAERLNTVTVDDNCTFKDVLERALDREGNENALRIFEELFKKKVVSVATPPSCVTSGDVPIECVHRVL